MAFIDQKAIFESTDGGRLIIEQYYPSSVESFRNTTRKFKCRPSEKTASASVKRMPDGNWIVTDFGEDAKGMNAIQVVMKEEKVEFGDAIKIIAAQFGIVPDEKRAEVFKPEIRKTKATAEQIDGTWQFYPREFTWRDITTILAPKVVEYLVSQCKADEAANVEDKIVKEVSRIFEKYNFKALENYTIIKDGNAIEIRATDLFPIYLFDEGDWKKVYKPKEVLGSNRFMHYPKDVASPKDHLFGWKAAKAAHNDITAISDSDDDEEEIGPKKIKKLKNIFLCSGGSDGLNLAVVGMAFKDTKKPENVAEILYPVWQNSETARLSPGNFRNLQSIALSIYNIPDIDATGKAEAHKLALQYLEIKTVYLPENLKLHADTYRKKPLKDLRDYFKYFKVWDFFDLIKTAYAYRFWDVKVKVEKDEDGNEKKITRTYNVNNKHLYNFLARNGFYRYAAESEKEGYYYIKVDGNIVKQIDPKTIRDFINSFIEERNPDVELMNTFLRTNQLSESSLSNLPYITIDFTDYDAKNQWFFYNNLICNVNGQSIEPHKPGQVHKYVWADEVIKHDVKVLDPFFTVGLCSNIQTKEESLYINIKNLDCLVFRYLINASRIYWREELERRLDGIPGEEQAEYSILHNIGQSDMALLKGLKKADREKYLIENKFNIAGPLLTASEQSEQMMQLINKLYSIGYIFHRQKEASRAWAIWAMDYKISDGEESHGGSGKSLTPMLIYENKIMKAQYREGRNIRLTDNPHIYEGIDRHTDLLIIDDCNRFLKFDFFFSAITGPIAVNPKNAKQYTVSFKESPKLWFSSNYTPYQIDPSMERRILYMIFSDYYHYNKMGEYNEERRVFDDFGKNLGSDFTPEEWNLCINFFMQCTQFYLATVQKINPPMDNINKRNLKSAMGDAFEPWADVYFSEESGRLNTDVIKEEAMSDYVRSSNQKNLTSQRFKKQLHAWCQYNGIVLNPKDMTSNKNQIIKRMKWTDKDGNQKEGIKEVIYLQPVSGPEQKTIEKYNIDKGREISNENQETAPF